MGEYHEEQYEIIYQDTDSYVLKIHKFNGVKIDEFGETIPTYIPTDETFTAKMFEVLSFEDQGYLLN